MHQDTHTHTLSLFHTHTQSADLDAHKGLKDNGAGSITRLLESALSCNFEGQLA